MEATEAIALVKGHVEHELLLRNEYLAAENEILRSRIEGRLILTKAEKVRLARIGKVPVKLPGRSPNLNAFAERWILSGKAAPATGRIECQERSGATRTAAAVTPRKSSRGGAPAATRRSGKTT